MEKNGAVSSRKTKEDFISRLSDARMNDVLFDHENSEMNSKEIIDCLLYTPETEHFSWTNAQTGIQCYDVF